MPGMGSCSRLAKWTWDRLGGGCRAPLLECWNGVFKERAHIGVHETRVQVQSPALKEWCSAATAWTISCPFCWSRTGTHTGHFNFKNPWYGIIHQDARYGIRNAPDVNACVRSWWNWRASCVATKQQQKKCPWASLSKYFKESHGIIGALAVWRHINKPKKVSVCYRLLCALVFEILGETR